VTDTRPTRRRRRLVPILLLGAGAGAWVIATRRSARPVDGWAARPPSAPSRSNPAPAVAAAASPTEPVPVQAAAPSAPAAASAPVAAPLRSPSPSPSPSPRPRPPAPAEAGPFGPGSAAPRPDGSAPGPDFTIKGNSGSMLFHPPSSPYYSRTKAEVWFRTPEDASAAGFTAYAQRRKTSS
jgi:hypothetical protein